MSCGQNASKRMTVSTIQTAVCRSYVDRKSSCPWLSRPAKAVALGFDVVHLATSAFSSLNSPISPRIARKRAEREERSTENMASRKNLAPLLVLSAAFGAFLASLLRPNPRIIEEPVGSADGHLWSIDYSQMVSRRLTCPELSRLTHDSKPAWIQSIRASISEFARIDFQDITSLARMPTVSSFAGPAGADSGFRKQL